MKFNQIHSNNIAKYLSKLAHEIKLANLSPENTAKVKKLHDFVKSKNNVLTYDELESSFYIDKVEILPKGFPLGLQKDIKDPIKLLNSLQDSYITKLFSEGWKYISRAVTFDKNIYVFDPIFNVLTYVIHILKKLESNFSTYTISKTIQNFPELSGSGTFQIELKISTKDQLEKIYNHIEAKKYDVGFRNYIRSNSSITNKTFSKENEPQKDKSDKDTPQFTGLESFSDIIINDTPFKIKKLDEFQKLGYEVSHFNISNPDDIAQHSKNLDLKNSDWKNINKKLKAAETVLSKELTQLVTEAEKNKSLFNEFDSESTNNLTKATSKIKSLISKNQMYYFLGFSPNMPVITQIKKIAFTEEDIHNIEKNFKQNADLDQYIKDKFLDDKSDPTEISELFKKHRKQDENTKKYYLDKDFFEELKTLDVKYKLTSEDIDNISGFLNLQTIKADYKDKFWKGFQSNYNYTPSTTIQALTSYKMEKDPKNLDTVKVIPKSNIDPGNMLLNAFKKMISGIKDIISDPKNSEILKFLFYMFMV